ncbi:MAG: ABC transporter permease [Propionibacteriaceae bacterium]
MLRQAWTELRLHPGRFMAVLLAVAISIAFLTVSQVFVQTEADALAKREVLYTMSADIVASAPENTGPVSEVEQEAAAQTIPADLIKELKTISGVTAVDYVYHSSAEMTLPNGEDTYQAIYSIPAESSLGWLKLDTGSIPSEKSHIVLNKKYQKEGFKIGDTVRLGGGDNAVTMTITGFAAEPTSLATPIAYVTRDAISGMRANHEMPIDAYNFMIKVDNPGQSTAVVNAVNAKLKTMNLNTVIKADTSENVQKDALTKVTNNVNVPKYILGVFAVIALLVGAIIIANTFQILVAQRRRQVGLLRAVGASSGQVFRRFLGESILLGAVGSLAGVILGSLLSAAASWLWTGNIVYGLSIPWVPIVTIFIAGVVITVVSSIFPIRAALKVMPLEALHPAATIEQQRKASRVRIVVCTILAVIGTLAVVGAFMVKPNMDSPQAALQIVGLALLGCSLLSLAILVGAPLYVPSLIRLLGKIFCHTRTSKLAVENSIRNPKRAAATALALMLAVGLISTIQVAAATARKTTEEVLDQRYPLDITFRLYDSSSNTAAVNEFSSSDLAAMKKIPHVAEASILAAGEGSLIINGVRSGGFLVRYDAELEKFSSATLKPSDTEILLNPAYIEKCGLKDGGKYTVELKSFSQADDKKQMQLTVRAANAAESPIVSPEVFSQLSSATAKSFMVVKLDDRNKAIAVMKDATKALTEHSGDMIYGGGALMKSVLTAVIDVLLAIVTALLAVAAFIALIGVGNTLGLSVIERTRESALLRALGLQASGLRVLLLVEALLLAGVGTLVGIGMGLLFGWIGSKNVLRAMGLKEYYFAVDGWYLVGTVVIATIAAALASVLPGRKAAKATPVEALADVG